MFACIYGQSIPNGVSLADFAYSFSPFVEETAPHTIVIDIGGCELLFGSAWQLANDIATRATKGREAGGLECEINVAIAANPDAAIHAARFFKAVSFISPGDELACFENFPLWLLDCSLAAVEEAQAEEIFETLKLWGIRTFGAFAALPIAGVFERLGEAGMKLQQLAAGKTKRHLNLKPAAPVFANSIELDYPITELEPLSFVLARLLNQLCASLDAYAFATNEIGVDLKLETGASHERKLSLPFPLRDPKVLRQLFLLDVETHPPPSPVIAVAIACEPVKPRVLQNGLFIPLSPEPDKLELTLARLAKLVGADHVGAPDLLDTHRPDAFGMKRFGIPQRRKKSVQRQSVIVDRRPVIGFRVFRPSLSARVETAQGQPVRVSARDSLRTIRGNVIWASGPWRASGDWWRGDMWARDEWDVTLRNHEESDALYRVYQDSRSGLWFVAGMYD